MRQLTIACLCEAVGYIYNCITVISKAYAVNIPQVGSIDQYCFQRLTVVNVL